MTKATEQKAPVGLKCKVDAVKKQLVITVDLTKYEFEHMVTNDLSKYDLVGDGKKSVMQDGKRVEVDNSSQANYRVATTFNWEQLRVPGFEHISFNINAIAKRKPVEEEKARRYELEQQRKIASEVKSEQKASTTTTAPANDIELLKSIVKANPSAFASLTPEQQAKLMAALI